MLSIVLAANAQSTLNEVRIPTEAAQIDKFPDRLVVAALERGNTYKAVYPYGNIQSLPLSKRINDVRNLNLDLFFGLATPEYEEEFLPIYIPLYRGMMGMRLAIVKRENREIFRDVTNLQQLKQFIAGQGKLWADSKILEANNIPLVKEAKYRNLFRMLEADRFDYFPRGIHEPWKEVEDWQKLDLVVDKHIMLWYTVPFYYFVHRSNTDLAEHLTEQIEAMIADGSFMEMFYEDEDVQAAFKQAKIDERTIIRLENPFLSAATPIERKELWFNADTHMQ